MGVSTAMKREEGKKKVAGVKVKKLISIDGGWLTLIEGSYSVSTNAYIVEAVREKMKKDKLLK